MSLLTASTFFHESSSLPHAMSDDPYKQIGELLDQSESFFIQGIEDIIKEWKHAKMKQYKKILSNIDASLRRNVMPVICEQICIQRQHLQKIINQVQRDLAKGKKQPAQGQDKTILMAKNKERTCSSSFKPRSMSNDSHSRRKLSKGSFFAQAKKVAPEQSKINNFMASSTSAAGFGNKFDKFGSKITKTKRKEQNCFKALEKCNNNISPSNFMLNYIKDKEVLKSNDQNIIQKSKFKNQLSHEKPILEIQSPAKANTISPQTTSNQYPNETQTYQKLMINFQQKISKKLDDLMTKYTKIQEKLQTHQQEKPQKYVLKMPQKLQRQKENTVSIEQSLNVNNDSLVRLPQVSMVSLKHLNDKVCLNEAKMNSTSKNDTIYEQTNTRQQSAKKGPKSIQINSKIIKNKPKIIQNFESSLQEIQICKQKAPLSSFNHEQAAKHQSHQRKRLEQQSEKRKALQSDLHYFQEVIKDFNAMTQTNKIPITNQLMYIILSNYETFCKANSLQPNQEIMILQTKKLENIHKQHLALLEKMEKIMDSKAQKLKKERMLKYFAKYTKVAITYDQKSNLVIRCEQPSTDNELKTRFQQLKLQVSQA